MGSKFFKYLVNNSLKFLNENKIRGKDHDLALFRILPNFYEPEMTFAKRIVERHKKK